MSHLFYIIKFYYNLGVNHFFELLKIKTLYVYNFRGEILFLRKIIYNFKVLKAFLILFRHYSYNHSVLKNVLTVITYKQLIPEFF